MVLILGWCWGLLAMATTLPSCIETWLASYTDNQEQAETMILLLQEKLEHPINLNDVNRETLEQFPFLSERQIENLLEYRHDRDFFATPYELSLIAGFDEYTLSLLLPFVTAQPIHPTTAFSFKNSFKYGKHQITTRLDYTLQEKLGYQNGKYLGKPWAGYMNYQLNQEQFSMSATMEQDAGEPFTPPYNIGFDFYSGILEWKNIGVLKSLVIGDYTAQFGQGLVMGNNASYGNVSSMSSMVKRQDKLAGKKKGSETYYLRGTGLTLQSNHWQFSAFASINYTDSAGGIHRTLSDWEKKKSGYQWLVGTNVHVRYPHFKIGTTCIYDAYTQLAFMGLDYRTYYKNFQFSGELAVNHLSKIATLQNVQVQLHSSLLYALQVRYYDKAYNNASGYSNIETCYKNGEMGIFTGLEWQISQKIKLNTAADIYQSLQQGYRVSKPAIHYKTFLSMVYTPHQNQQLLAKWQWILGERNASNTSESILPTHRYYKNQLQAIYQGTFSNGCVLKSGWIVHFFQYHTTDLCLGNVLYQDIGWKNNQFSITTRLAFFDVPDYDNKITVYENDVLYAFSNTAYYGKGVKTYLNVCYKPYKGWGLYLKLSHTWYLHKSSIGSGNETIQGPHQTYLHFLLQYKW